jgi:hypothetical protein
VEVDAFLHLAEALTGTPVKEVTDRDYAFLGAILGDEDRPIDCSQFNELLLLVNKDRVEPAFFDHFLRAGCRVGALREGVGRFQEAAMLRYGNFIHAYRILARLRTAEELKRELGELARDSHEVLQGYANRSPKLLDVELIPRADTPLVGYLSAREIIAEDERARLLAEALPPAGTLPGATWDAFAEAVRARARAEEHRPLLSVLANYRARYHGASVADFATYLADARARLGRRVDRLAGVRAQAVRNQDVYLTWDHMDVYFATSMRKRWEYEDLYDFVQGLMGREELTGLNLRYFDPTQSFTDNRVNKGLVESLMLKRAQGTVYSVQDTDTLGKDSELAATLAQGKPVIAYVPEIEPQARVAQLMGEDPVTIQDRLRFVIYADESLVRSLDVEDLEFLQGFRELERFEQGRLWRSLPDEGAAAALRAELGARLERVCRIIAAAESRIYNRRAVTLRENHPLAIQVNLDTGVANGVLVVRRIPDCARLLRQVLTGTMEFDLRKNDRDRMWYLRERISGCAYRVVSLDRKLTNCFWNFYRRPQG